MPTIPLPNLVYTSGDTTTATPVGLPRLIAPFAGVNAYYVLEQDFIQQIDTWSPAPLNTPHYDLLNFSGYLLVSESPLRDVNGGKIRWTRTYAQVPQRYSQPQGFQYSFIGYLTTGTPSATGRARDILSVAGRLQFDYFILDPNTGNIIDAAGNPVFTGTPGVLPSIVDVPILQVQKYFGSGIGDVKFGIEADFISYGPAAAVPQTNYPTPVLGDTNYPPYAAYPTREVYESWRDRTSTVSVWNEATNTMVDTGLYEIVAQGSQCLRWMGNIIERQTLYIRPQ